MAMTWTRAFLFLLVLLNTCNLLTADCWDYFIIKEWPSIKISLENLTQTVPVVKGPTLNATVRCTLEKEKSKRDVDHFLNDCFSTNENIPCENETFGELYFFHFMCLMAQAINVTLQGCDYGMLQQISSSFGPTTTATATTATTTTMTTTTTTTTELLSPTTKTLETTVTLCSSASSSVVSSSTSVQPTPTTAAESKTTLTHSNEDGQVDKQEDGPRTSDCERLNVTLQILVSVLGTVVLVLVLLLYVLCKHRRQQRQRPTHMDTGADVLMNCADGDPSQSQPNSSGTDADADADADAEQTSRLMQDPALRPDAVTEEKDLGNGRVASNSCEV
ncbi:uncharacterized protein LOC115416085 [Sphaeramia orbicularis]|uniref:uncharacterized protein LOC115416085 n=1 Tax=Sphaeramia orbicularis TaxID=375764 RepID=UPI00117F19BC|nr:uncharacterized protein LOC115416085 [Sphaeramia orbicularis]